MIEKSFRTEIGTALFLDAELAKFWTQSTWSVFSSLRTLRRPPLPLRP